MSKLNARQRRAKARLLKFFVANVGRVVTSDEVRLASGSASGWAFLVRELRDDNGWQILSHGDRRELGLDEFLLDSLRRLPAFDSDICKGARARVLEQQNLTCLMCGFGAEDVDPYEPSCTVRLTVDLFTRKNRGGTDEPGNIRVLCMNCDEGSRTFSKTKIERLQLFARLRGAADDDQRAVMEWLLPRFKV